MKQLKFIAKILLGIVIGVQLGYIIGRPLIILGYPLVGIIGGITSGFHGALGIIIIIFWEDL